MTIVIWVEQYLFGGVDTHLLTLLKNWEKKDAKIIIFTNNIDQIKQKKFEELFGFKSISFREIIGIPSQHKNIINTIICRFFFPIWFLFLLIITTINLSRCGKIDVLISDNGGYPGGLSNLAVLGASVLYRCPVRFLLVHHAADHPAYLRIGFETLMDHFVQKWASGIISVSLATRESLRIIRGFSFDKCPLHIIHNGIDQSKLNINPQPTLKKRHGIPKKSFVIGMVGRIERYKGHEDLIMALADLPFKYRSKCVALFVGSGDSNEINRLKTLANNLKIGSQIYFSGFVDENIQTIMRQFNLLAMLTKDFEGFGLTVAEALVAGTPVLATSVGAVPEVIHEGVGWLVTPDSPEEVKHAILEILQKPNEVKEKIRKGKKHILKFGAKVMAKKYQRLIQREMGVW